MLFTWRLGTTVSFNIFLGQLSFHLLSLLGAKVLGYSNILITYSCICSKRWRNIGVSRLSVDSRQLTNPNEPKSFHISCSPVESFVNIYVSNIIVSAVIRTTTTTRKRRQKNNVLIHLLTNDHCYLICWTNKSEFVGHLQVLRISLVSMITLVFGTRRSMDCTSNINTEKDMILIHNNDFEYEPVLFIVRLIVF